ncbi:ABC transporter ATP-binding protein [Paraburkholderia humisilvae]|uniref:Oligopeptide transport ATP-binding protein OppF n=1 Tax=Paraburkholderia humisilvae TaxID=627669 RepID=A0A6J5F8X6_9BURK|nr:ABC transporter ATP-binding protein [Paraburkholderia humisilvae]CAB3773715.1 Oligopeptide transport ATP-binding protein OppF [Paraburkholderia humisilvae]
MTTSTDDAAPLLVLDHVTKHFRAGDGSMLRAVHDVSLTVHAGEIVALVGESGSGKSTLGRMALGLMQPDAGSVSFDGHVLGSLSSETFRRLRTGMQPIFQDSAASLNPRKTVQDMLTQALWMYRGDLQARCITLLEDVGLRPASTYLRRYPHELSGGQRQRVSIARALAMQPRLIVADEPLSGADVSIRGQVLNLLLDIQRQRSVAYLMITHDISIARAFADRVVVMHKGEMVEAGVAAEVLERPVHAYTRRLVAAVPMLGG